LLIDFLLIRLEDSADLNINMCKFELSWKAKSRAQFADSWKVYIHKTISI